MLENLELVNEQRRKTVGIYERVKFSRRRPQKCGKESLRCLVGVKIMQIWKENEEER